ncbi:leucyl aminopeptidase [Mycena leptocephala]|nr:leucyl aminopeptidase [Mycena leptocephala]
MAPASLDTYRLPTDAVPIHYDLKIRTDLKEFTFDGAVAITIRFNTDTPTIVLNVFELELGTASIAVGDEKFIPTTQSINTDTQRVALSFAKAFSSGSEVVLRMTFRGKIAAQKGYYKSEWAHDGVTEHYTATFFEPTYARRAFPCWDEPALKATFAVSLVSRAGTVNLGNMPAFFEGLYDPAQDPLEPSFGAGKDASEWIITRFATTPKMSTYIVAYANGPFTHVESSFNSSLTGKACPVRIYATPDLIGQAQFPLELTTKVLPMLEKMFDLEYPLPKMDILRTGPWFGDLSCNLFMASQLLSVAGVLENWGLIAGEPGAFLFDPATGSTAMQKRIVSIISHELAHQWFGNIVTMEWWDNLWLNEGFATLLGAVISDKLYPEWNTAAATVNASLKYALNVDAKLSSHPVQVECPDANHVNEIMDTIAYMKGSSRQVLGMVSSLLGEEAFFKGVALYLKERQFSNSVAEDLWDALRRTSGMDIVNLMKNWISETGYPVLTVTEAPGGINVQQNRFLASGIANAKDDGTLCTPFKLNAGSTGFYRVLYQSEKLNRRALDAAKGNISDMAGLMNDAMALAKPTCEADERLDIDGWLCSGDRLGLLDAWWEHPTILEQLQSLERVCYSTLAGFVLTDTGSIQHIFVPLVAELGYEYHSGESTDTAAIRTLAVKRAADARDPRPKAKISTSSTVAELQTRFAKFMAKKEASPLPPDLVQTIYTLPYATVESRNYEDDEVAGGGGTRSVCYLLFVRAHTDPLWGRLKMAIGAAEDPILMAETFNRVLNENDGLVDWLLYALTAHPKSRRPMAQFFKDNYDALQVRFETSGFEHYSQQPFRMFTTEQDYEDTVAFFKVFVVHLRFRPSYSTIFTDKGYLEVHSFGGTNAGINSHKYNICEGNVQAILDH